MLSTRGRTALNLREAYEAVLPLVEQPSRYTGGELGTTADEKSGAQLHFALAFPEVYEIAQSHYGLQVLYSLLNRRDDVQAERVFAPWMDMEEQLRKRNLPLVSLETYRQLGAFNIIGFSLQYELTYTNVLTMLDLGEIPLLSRERDSSHPLIIAGGPCAFHPEPIADFIDAFLLGDGEEAIFDICDAYLGWDGANRNALLEQLRDIPGLYVPQFFEARYTTTGTLEFTEPRDSSHPTVSKRIVKDLNSVPALDQQIVPNLNIVHDRVAVEVMRGCVRGCRFCQAGYIYRPLRERDPRALQEQVETLVKKSGYEEISLLSLSTGDYSCVNPLLRAIMNQFSDLKVSVSLPSTRVDALSPHILEEIRRVRKTGFTLAPEAGSQRLRDVIQKEYQEEELIEAAKLLFGLGWKSVKLYFMLGQPTETIEDLMGIVELCRKVSAAGKHQRKVTASVSTFIPKPHTPFQWAAQVDLEETEGRQRLLKRELRKIGVQFKWHDARLSHLEGVFARGDRRLGKVLLKAYQLGCRFDGWTEHFRLELWNQAFETSGIDPNWYLRRRLLDEALPWDHLDSGVTKKWLQRDLAKALQGTTTPDCSVERCSYCGACDFESVKNVTYHKGGAKGGAHRGSEVNTWASSMLPEHDAWGTRQWQLMQRKKAVQQQKKVERYGGILDPSKLEAQPLEPSTSLPVLDDPITHDTSGNAEEWLAGDPNSIASSVANAPIGRARYRVSYSKLAPARFLGAKEVSNVFSRACRRASIPVAYSQGFHPLPRISFGPALPVGMESQDEFLDIVLGDAVEPGVIMPRLNAELPDGFNVRKLDRIPLDKASVDSDILRHSYEVNLECLPHSIRDAKFIAERLRQFFDAETYPMQKRTRHRERTIDAKSLIKYLTFSDPVTLNIDVATGSEGSIKVTEFLGVLLNLTGDEVKMLRVMKMRTHLKEAPITHAAQSEIPTFRNNHLNTRNQ